MYVSGTGRRSRIGAGIMVFIMLFFILSASLFTLVEAHHECEGDDCVICECIRQCEEIIHGSCQTVTWRSAALPTALLFIAVSLYVCFIISDSLVSSKVRLND